MIFSKKTDTRADVESTLGASLFSMNGFKDSGYFDIKKGVRLDIRAPVDVFRGAFLGVISIIIHPKL